MSMLSERIRALSDQGPVIARGVRPVALSPEAAWPSSSCPLVSDSCVFSEQKDARACPCRVTICDSRLQLRFHPSAGPMSVICPWHRFRKLLVPDRYVVSGVRIASSPMRGCILHEDGAGMDG
jgi:hypothetical protein